MDVKINNNSASVLALIALSWSYLLYEPKFKKLSKTPQMWHWKILSSEPFTFAVKGLREYQEVVLRHISKNIGHTTSPGVAAADYVAPKEQEVCF